MIANVVPLRGGKDAKPNQTFQADNFVVLNAKGQSNEKAMQLEDWVSIKENHDLLSYGVEGKDWKPVGDDKYEQLSTTRFPGLRAVLAAQARAQDQGHHRDRGHLVRLGAEATTTSPSTRTPASSRT